MAYCQPDIPTLERQTFVETFKYKLIYVYTIDDRKHEGYLKVGDTDVVSTLVPDQLTPNMLQIPWRRHEGACRADNRYLQNRRCAAATDRHHRYHCLEC